MNKFTAASLCVLAVVAVAASNFGQTTAPTAPEKKLSPPASKPPVPIPANVISVARSPALVVLAQVPSQAVVAALAEAVPAASQVAQCPVAALPQARHPSTTSP
jgi:hypothetical protein